MSTIHAILLFVRAIRVPRPPVEQVLPPRVQDQERQGQVARLHQANKLIHSRKASLTISDNSDAPVRTAARQKIAQREQHIKCPAAKPAALTSSEEAV